MINTNPHHQGRAKSRLLLASGFIVLATLGILTALFVSSIYHKNALAEAERYQSAKAQIIVNKVRTFLMSATQLAETLRVLVEQYNGKERMRIEEFLDRIVESAPEDLVYGAGIWYEPYRFESTEKYFGPYVHRGSQSGQRVLTYEWTTPEYNFHKQAWYEAGVQMKGKPTFTDPYYDAGIVYMTMALAFFDRSKGELNGVISVDMVLPQLQKIIDLANEQSTDVVFVVGKSDYVLAHPTAEDIVNATKKTGLGEAITSILNVDRSTALRFVKDPLTFETVIENIGWKVIVASPKSIILQSYLELRFIIVAATFVYLIILATVFILIHYFNEKVRRLKERAFNEISYEKSQIAAIVDNVKYGLLRVDRDGIVQLGYSKSCYDILGNTRGDIAARHVWDILRLSGREQDNYKVFFTQVFEIPDLAEQLAGQIPSLVEIDGKQIEIHHYPIMRDGHVESVLVSLDDITKTKATERENENNKALLCIVQNKERFRRILHDIHNADESMLFVSSSANQDAQNRIAEVRRQIHTWKGDLMTLGLSEIGGFIHRIEDEMLNPLTPAQSHELIHQLKSKLHDFMHQHFDTIRLTPDLLHEQQFMIQESSLRKLQDMVSVAPTGTRAAQIVGAFIQEQDMERGHDLLNYLSFAAQELARKLRKSIKVETAGGDHSLPKRFGGILNSLIHVIRNAVDHGIEESSRRGQKDPTGKITIEITSDSENYHIVISDDGRGIDLDKLAISAIQSGVVSREVWDALGTDEKLRYVFQKNLSTKDAVTANSGRGVGLDAVLANVEAQGGSIVIGTNSGFGTCFDFVLPKEDKKTEQSKSGHLRQIS